MAGDVNINTRALKSEIQSPAAPESHSFTPPISRPRLQSLNSSSNHKIANVNWIFFLGEISILISRVDKLGIYKAIFDAKLFRIWKGALSNYPFYLHHQIALINAPRITLEKSPWISPEKMPLSWSSSCTGWFCKATCCELAFFSILWCFYLEGLEHHLELPLSFPVSQQQPSFKRLPLLAQIFPWWSDRRTSRRILQISSKIAFYEPNSAN